MVDKAKGKTGQQKAAEKRRFLVIEDRQKEAFRLWFGDGKKGMSCRQIGQELGISHEQANKDLKAWIAKQSEKDKREVAVNVRKEFGEQLKFAKKLREAAEEYLSSESDPMRLVLIPRADEIEVVYFDFADKTERGEPKKKTASLHALLAKTEGLNIEADKINIKHVDMRKFALDAINTTDTCIDKFAKLGGDYTRDKVNPANITDVADAVVQKLIDNGWAEDEARAFAAQQYPEISDAIN